MGDRDPLYPIELAIEPVRATLRRRDDRYAPRPPAQSGSSVESSTTTTSLSQWIATMPVASRWILGIDTLT